METWREEAIRTFPELDAETFSRLESSYQLWFELRRLFESAYDSDNEELIKRIYHYARWCENQTRGTSADDDLPTSVAVCFYEHIPEHHKALKDMPRWFSIDEVKMMKSLFTYAQGQEGYENILRQYAA